MKDFTSHITTAVITTIQPPTTCVNSLVARLQEYQINLIVAGDEKGPDSYDLPNTRFLSLKDQLESPFTLAVKLPVCHYTRKNVAYLSAIASGASCIYETDDDNAPNEHWAPRTRQCEAQPVDSEGWCNVYRLFSSELIWPRGFPLQYIRQEMEIDESSDAVTVEAPIQQSLADGAPDVDAVWRLILDRPITFQRQRSVALGRNVWCPFNSQSTWWWLEAYPLLYLPSHCSFRMTDIWRSFVAQRCLWELDRCLVFHAAEVVQDRNVHNLMHDFADEIPGYQSNVAICNTLEKLELDRGRDAISGNMIRCYQAMIDGGFVGKDEVMLLEAWLNDLKKIHSKRSELAEQADRVS